MKGEKLTFLILLIILIVAINGCYNYCLGQVVTGHLKYNKCCESGDQLVGLGFRGHRVGFKFNSLDSVKVRELVLKFVAPSDIISARGFSNDSTIEVFWCYKGIVNDLNEDIKLETGSHSIGGYASNNGFIAPFFSKIGTGLDVLGISIAKIYPLKTFMLRNYEARELPFFVLGHGVKNGNLADMRNIKNSYRLVDYFKELNWKIIWYKDQNGVVKSLFRNGLTW
jgi:hypothetical protein